LTEHPALRARRGHPLPGAAASGPSTFGFLFVAPSRIPPRLLEPMLEAQRRAPDPADATRAFPALECNALSVVKRIVASSDAITAVSRPCIARELEDGELALLGTEPWLTVRYGLVGLKGQPLSDAAARLREFFLDAERASSLRRSASLPVEPGAGR
jgi:DNA-binding transcriptional LysR family regulator